MQFLQSASKSRKELLFLKKSLIIETRNKINGINSNESLANETKKLLNNNLMEESIKMYDSLSCPYKLTRHVIRK